MAHGWTSPSDYAVIIDRISHEVPFYRSYLKHAALHGVEVINNPFMWTADDKFFDASLATQLGVAQPEDGRAAEQGVLPGIEHDESLRNLDYPLDWEGIVDYVGLPCVLKDAHGGGWRDVYICHSLEELFTPTTIGAADDGRFRSSSSGISTCAASAWARRRCCR